MRHFWVGCFLLLTACSSAEREQGWLTGDAWSIEEAAALPPPEDPYLAALREGYLKLAEAELEAFDWSSAADFRARAISAASGNMVPPTEPTGGFFSAPDEALVAAYQEITAYIASEGAMLRARRQIGDAQVQYDCWVEETGEGVADAIGACREQYQLLIILVRDLADLPDNMAVVLPEDEGGEIGGIELTQDGKTITLDREFAAAGVGEAFGDLPVTEGEIRDAFAGALGARPPPPKEFVITFAFNSARISNEAFEGVLAAAKEARSRPAPEVIVTGYADAVGDRAANRAISARRARVVARAIFNELRGDEDVTFQTVAKGESDLAVRKPGFSRDNRRVVILVR